MGFDSLATVAETAFVWRAHLNANPATDAGKYSTCYANVAVIVSKLNALVNGYCSFEACKRGYAGSDFKEKVAARIHAYSPGARQTLSWATNKASPGLYGLATWAGKKGS